MALADEGEERVVLFAKRRAPLLRDRAIRGSPTSARRAGSETPVLGGQTPTPPKLACSNQCGGRLVDAKRCVAEILGCCSPRVCGSGGWGSSERCSSRRRDRRVSERRCVRSRPGWLGDRIIVDEGDELAASRPSHRCCARGSDPTVGSHDPTSSRGLGKPMDVLVSRRVVDDNHLVTGIVESTEVRVETTIELSQLDGVCRRQQSKTDALFTRSGLASRDTSSRQSESDRRKEHRHC